MNFMTLVWEFLTVFFQFLVERRADDMRLWNYAQQVQQNLESDANKDKTGTEKYELAFGMLMDYGKALGIDIGAAALDSILAITLPAARKKAAELSKE